MRQHISSAPAHIECASTYRVRQHISSAPAHIACVSTYRVRQHISSAPAHIECASTYRVRQHISSAPAHIECASTYTLHRPFFVTSICSPSQTHFRRMNSICLASLGLIYFRYAANPKSSFFALGNPSRSSSIYCRYAPIRISKRSLSHPYPRVNKPPAEVCGKPRQKAEKGVKYGVHHKNVVVTEVDRSYIKLADTGY